MMTGEKLRGLAWMLVGCALFIHARSYDFFADDGFIALRYSQNLIEHGELAYNPGDRVEGFTSPLWVLLVALLGLLGGSLVGWAQALGAGCALATLYAVARLWKTFAPDYSPWGAVVVGALLASSASFAAWTMGGLEAPLFAFCLTSAFASLGEACRHPIIRRWVTCGVWCALASLARPEGMALVLPALVMATIYAYRTRTWMLLAGFCLPVAGLLGGYFVFRIGYYGYPLPNTYYIKTSGGRGLARRGVRYVTTMANEYGWVTVVCVAVAIAAPLLLVRQRLRTWLALDTRFVLHTGLSCVCVLFVVYLTRVGGDFLDLYRFVAPILPLAFVLVVASAIGTWRWLRTWVQPSQITAVQWLLVVTALLVAFDYSRHQLWMAVRSTDAKWYERPRSAPDKPVGVEPVHWTRMAALRWSALGRALRDAAVEGDTMATGAAGAAPYSARLPNLDLFGLNDEWVAHHGRVVGNRPGHQRTATVQYIARKKPTFLFAAGAFRNRARKPRPDKVWSKRGYVAAELRVDRTTYGAPRTFYQPLFVRKHRVKDLERRPEWRFAKHKKSAKR